MSPRNVHVPAGGRSPRFFHHDLQPCMEDELNEGPRALDIAVVIVGLDEPRIDDCEPDIVDIAVIIVFGCVAVIAVIGLGEPVVDGCELDIVVIVVVGCVAVIAVVGLDELVVDGCEPDTAAIGVLVVFGCVPVNELSNDRTD